MLDGAAHLRNVGVLVVVPGHDLHLIGVVVDALLRNALRLYLKITRRLFFCLYSDKPIIPHSTGLLDYNQSLSHQENKVNKTKNYVKATNPFH